MAAPGPAGRSPPGHAPPPARLLPPAAPQGRGGGGGGHGTVLPGRGGPRAALAAGQGPSRELSASGLRCTAGRRRSHYGARGTGTALRGLGALGTRFWGLGAEGGGRGWSRSPTGCPLLTGGFPAPQVWGGRGDGAGFQPLPPTGISLGQGYRYTRVGQERKSPPVGKACCTKQFVRYFRYFDFFFPPLSQV